MTAGRLTFGYVTNGLINHRLDEAIGLLAENGYDGIALTLDFMHLDPFAAEWRPAASALRKRLAESGLACVVETGSRFVLDPRRKHFPTLLHGGTNGARRLSFLRRAIEIAVVLEAPVVSTWSGALPEDVPPDVARNRLVEALGPLAELAERSGTKIGFEPEPGMFVESIRDLEMLRADLGNPSGLGTTLDIGHCICLEPEPVDACIRRVAETGNLVHVHIEDMRRNVHEHLMFGEGELDLPLALSTLAETGYDGMVAVELSRDAHRAHEVVPGAIRALRAAETGGEGE